MARLITVSWFYIF